MKNTAKRSNWFSVQLKNKEEVEEAYNTMEMYDSETKTDFFNYGVKLLKETHGIDDQLLFLILSLLKEEKFIGQIKELYKLKNKKIDILLKEIINEKHKKEVEKEEEKQEIKNLSFDEIGSHTKGGARARIAKYIEEIISQNENAKDKNEKRFISVQFCFRYMKAKGHSANRAKISQYLSEPEIERMIEKHHQKHDLEPEWNRKMASLERVIKNAERKKEE